MRSEENPPTTRCLRLALALIVVTLATGCGPAKTVDSQMLTNGTSGSEGAPLKSYNLTLSGYNYTDTEIGSFEVNGQGGGNIAVSSPTSGGGGSVCCVTVYSPMAKPQAVTIKWSRDGDTWCEQSVEVKPPLPSKPEYLEVHFYRDGHIELAVTEQASPPRLQLSREHGNSRFRNEKLNINNDSKSARCKLGY